jgi:hypothetical protein
VDPNWLRKRIEALRSRFAIREGSSSGVYEQEWCGFRYLQLPASQAQVEEAEVELGFPLPPLLRSVYMEIGNGGYSLQLIGLEGGQTGFDIFEGRDIVRAYQIVVQQPPTAYNGTWPDRLLPIYDGYGCCAMSLLDASVDNGQIFRWDPMAADACLSVEFNTLGDYFQALA